VAKPDPRIFELACGHLGVPARAAVYVGDRLEVDAVAAMAAGLRGIWLNRGGGAVPPGVEAIDDLAELAGRSTTDLKAATQVVRVAVADRLAAHPTSSGGG
jgi:FMN phosphatase YigB (HAD superfamily)